MSYATMAAFRIILPEETATADRVLQSYLDAAKSMIDLALGFQYDGPQVNTRVSSEGEPELYLPAPGASSITDIYEIDTLLTSAEWELDPIEGRYVIRLNVETAYPQNWAEGARIIRVRYVPAACPAALFQAELVEATRLWRGKPSGFSDVIGVEGVNDIGYSKGVAASTKLLIDSLRRKFQRAPGMGGA